MAKKSVFNKPMREAKPAKKIPVKIVEKPKPVSEPQSGDKLTFVNETKGKAAIDTLRHVISVFKAATGEQDVNRAQVDQFLRELDSAIYYVAAVFEP